MPTIKEAKETPPTEEPIKAARVVTGVELGAGIGLLAFSTIVPTAAVLWWGRPSTFAEFTSMVFLWIYMFAVIATFAIIILWGLGRLNIPDKFMTWLGGATVGEIVGLLAFAGQWIFKN